MLLLVASVKLRKARMWRSASEVGLEMGDESRGEESRVEEETGGYGGLGLPTQVTISTHQQLGPRT